MFIPKYKEVSEAIYQTYIAHNQESHAIMPTEEALCEEFNVSRTTVRKALSFLAEQDVLVHTRGKGYTMVKQNNIVTSKDTLGLYEDMIKIGKVSSSKIISSNILNCSPFIAEKLNIEPGSKVFHLIRLRYLEDKPYSITENFIPLHLYPDIHNVEFEHGSLWNYMKTIREMPKVQTQDIEIRKSLEADRYYLNLDSETPVMVFHNLAFSDNQPVDFSIIVTSAFKTKLHFSFLD